MAIDPFSPGTLAPVVALGGLGTMMLAPEPSWHSAGIGLACLLVFGGLSLLPSSREAGRPAARTRRGGPRATEGGEREAPAQAGRNPVVPEPAAPRGLNDPHPALFKGLRTRNRGIPR